MKKIKTETNGFVLWYRSRYGGKVAYAKQYEATDGSYDDKDPSTIPVYVAFDGAEPEDLIRVLEERDSLREKLQKLTNDCYIDLTYRIARLENKPPKKWYQFWK